MKKRMMAIVALIFALAGVQNAFAYLNCDGTVYFLLPDSWRSAYIVANGQGARMTRVTGNWVSVSTDQIGGPISATTFFIEETGDNSCNSGHCVRRDSMNVLYMSIDAPLFTCDDFGSTNELWISAHPDPSKKNVTYFGNVKPEPKYFFFMPPETSEWFSAVPMLSKDGGKTGVPMRAEEDRCGWYSYMFFNEDITDNVVIYRDDADVNPVTGIHEDAVGLNGDWETRSSPTPIPVEMFFDYMKETGLDTLFFIASEDLKDNVDGISFTDPKVEGICFYTLASLIYDTDANLHPSFSCWAEGGEGCQLGAQDILVSQALEAINNCEGVHAGLVESELDQTTKKPKLTRRGQDCFINADIFNELFSYTQGVNEVSCYDIPLHRTADNKWLFDSDNIGLGGFYPVEDELPLDRLVSPPLSAARAKREEWGPIFFGPTLREQDADEGFRKIDLLCNGRGWDKGMDCEGLFADGETTEAEIQSYYKMTARDDCVFGWSCSEKAPEDWTFFKQGTETVVDRNVSGANPRWKGKRNSHFCYESHAKFTYKPGQKFSFVGKDDAWVFIDNKLAVDLGGMHMPAPGYVDLDKFAGASGKLNVGDNYDIDIFFCNRQSGGSNSIRINTNINMVQKVAIEVKKSKNKTNPTKTSYEICYNESGDGSCAAAMAGGSDGNDRFCGNEILNNGIDVSYWLVRGRKISDSVNVGSIELSTPSVYNCIIDLRDYTKPVIGNSEDFCGLGAGRYSLFVKMEGKSKQLATFYFDGYVDVISAEAIAFDVDGNFMRAYKPVQEAVAGEMVPVYISSVHAPDVVGDPLTVIPEESVGSDYLLKLSSNLLKVYSKEMGNFIPLNPANLRKIGDSGVDTLYVTVAAEDLIEDTQEFSVGVETGKQTISLSFSLPRPIPVPVPVFADVFDARGHVPEEEYRIPAVYFSMNAEYLDGIADSVAVYYDRPIHKDSLPTHLCIEWDSESADAHHPVAEALSNVMTDTLIRCNELVKLDAQNVDCSNASKNGGYCSNIVTVGGLSLSSGVKTAGTGKVISYARFMDKGKNIREGFTGILIDRVAPVPLRAEIGNIKQDGESTNFDSLVITLSEPVMFTKTANKKSALDFYLNSAVERSEISRYVAAGTSVSCLGEGLVGISSNGDGRIKCMYKHGQIYSGDYVRLGGDIINGNVFWTDTAKINVLGADTLRAKGDAAYVWNSPTGYNEMYRFPSPWMVIEGIQEPDDPNERPTAIASSGFRTKKIGSSQFAFVVDAVSVGKSYAVMDLQGRVLCQGTVTSEETIVPVLASGSYVVKVGYETRRMNVR